MEFVVALIVAETSPDLCQEDPVYKEHQRGTVAFLYYQWIVAIA